MLRQRIHSAVERFPGRFVQSQFLRCLYEQGGGKGGARRIVEILRSLEKKGINIKDLIVRANSPIKFSPGHGGNPASGYEATILPDLCAVFIEAGRLRAFSKELAAWVKRFPDEFYENIYKLKGWPWPGMGKNRYSVVGHYTRDLVFERLGPGILEELEHRTPKDDRGNRSNKMHSWLSEDIGVPMLAQHMHTLVSFQKLAIKRGYGWNRFVKMVDEVMPRRGSTLELVGLEHED